MNNDIKPKDWSKGIPEYSEEDIMSEEKIHEFGVEIVTGQLQKRLI